MDDEGTEDRRDVYATRAQWGRAAGWVEVVNLATGEHVEIPYREATPVWKIDIARTRRQGTRGTP